MMEKEELENMLENMLEKVNQSWNFSNECSEEWRGDIDGIVVKVDAAYIQKDL